MKKFLKSFITDPIVYIGMAIGGLISYATHGVVGAWFLVAALLMAVALCLKQTTPKQ